MRASPPLLDGRGLEAPILDISILLLAVTVAFEEEKGHGCHDDDEDNGNEDGFEEDFDEAHFDCDEKKDERRRVAQRQDSRQV